MVRAPAVEVSSMGRIMVVGQLLEFQEGILDQGLDGEVGGVVAVTVDVNSDRLV
jgi:hypothetical protein